MTVIRIGPPIRVTHGAVRRYQELVAAVSYSVARSALMSKAVEAAADFGAPFVRLGTGQRIVVRHGSVVTVLAKGYWRGALGCADMQPDRLMARRAA
jgi:hypothetical protein